MAIVRTYLPLPSMIPDTWSGEPGDLKEAKFVVAGPEVPGRPGELAYKTEYSGALEEGPDGTITSLVHFDEGKRALQIEELSIEAGGYFDLLQDPQSSDALDALLLAGDDTITGSNGEDALFGLGGQDLLRGGEDIDTARFVGDRDAYTLTISVSGRGENQVTIQDRQEGRDGLDQLESIEFLEFASETFELSQFDGLGNTSPDELRSFIELYIAYFNRAPDSTGLNFWGTTFARGTSLEEMASFFAVAEETLIAFPEGTPNQDFVTTVYDNVLGRPPDQAGIDFWVDALSSGEVTRGQFILEILRGARSDLKPEEGTEFVDQQLADRAFLDNKISLGSSFAVTHGMSDGSKGATVMSLFTGSRESFDAAVQMIDTLVAEAQNAQSGDFIMRLEGLISDEVTFTETAVTTVPTESFAEIPDTTTRAYYYFSDTAGAFQTNTSNLGTEVDGLRLTVTDNNGVTTDVTIANEAARLANTWEAFVIALQPEVAQLIADGVLPTNTVLSIDWIDDRQYYLRGDGLDSIGLIPVSITSVGANVVPTGFSATSEFFTNDNMYGRFGTGVPTPEILDLPANTSTPALIKDTSFYYVSELSSPTDVDWYGIELEARHYSVSMADWSTSGVDSFLRLLDADGVEVLSADGSTGFSFDPLEARLEFVVETPGLYYIAAESSSQATSGQYRLFVSLEVDTTPEIPIVGGVDTPPTDPDVPGGLETTEVLVPNGGSVAGTIFQPGDADWFRLDVLENTDYTISLSASDDSLLDTVVRLLDINGNEVFFNDDSNDTLNSEIAFTSGASGVFYVSAQGFGDISIGAYDLQVTSDFVPPTDPDVLASVSTSETLVPNGAAVEGTIFQNGDDDWFRLNVIENAEYRITQSATSGSSLDSFLRLLDNQGNELLFNNDFNGTDSELNFTSGSTGFFFVSAQGTGVNSTGAYELRASEIMPTQPTEEELDVPATTGTSEVLTPNGGAEQGTIYQEGDADWFRLDVAANTNYRITQTATENFELDSFLRLLDSQGNEVLFNDDTNGLDSQINFTSGSTGVFYVSAQGFGDFSTGAYQLEVFAETPEQDFDALASVDTTAVLTPNGEAFQGTIDLAGDADWFRLDVVENTTYRITQSATNNFFLDSFLRLLDENGNEVLFNDDTIGLDSEISFTSGTTGTYYASAQGFGDFSTGAYELQAFII